jgi:hypothetical protein
MSEASMYRVIVDYLARLPSAVKDGVRIFSPLRCAPPPLPCCWMPVSISARARNFSVTVT